MKTEMMSPAPMAERREIPKEPKLWELSKKFEAVFANQMIDSMRKTVGQGGLVEKSQGEKIFESMLDQKFSEHMSESEQLGLSQMIYEQLLQSTMGR